MKNRSGGDNPALISSVPPLKSVAIRIEGAVAVFNAFLKRLRAPEEQAADAAAMLRTVRRLREELKQLEEVTPAVIQLEELLSDRADEQLLELESRLREACNLKGWRVDGQWPTLYIGRAISVEIDQPKRTVSVSGKKLGGSGLPDIVAALQPLVSGLVPKGFDPSAFMTEFSAAYELARRQSDQVPLFEVYKALVINLQGPRFWRDAEAGRFCGLSVDQFRARLSATLGAGLTTGPDGRELRLLPPLNPKDGLFLYQPAETRYGFVGRVEFVAAQSTERP